MSALTETETETTVPSMPATKRLKTAITEASEQEQDSRIYEYTSAANPYMAPVPVLGFNATLHQSGCTRIIPFDLSAQMQLKIGSPATSPNLLAAFLRIHIGEGLSTNATATSQAFYCIRGSGNSSTEYGKVAWEEGDLFVLPCTEHEVAHHATADSALYWITGAPPHSTLLLSFPSFLLHILFFCPYPSLPLVFSLYCAW